jgi:hypothetical protein
VDSFWDFFWFIISFFLLMAYLMVLFQILADLFRDRDESGWMKAVWIVFLIFFPIITALIYLIVRGHGMAERNVAAVKGMQEQQDAYIRNVAGSSPAEEIARAKALHEAGTITDAEFEALKAKALS